MTRHVRRVVATAGFSLVELVVVISLLAILAVGSVTFFGYSLDGYGRSGVRADLAASSMTALARMATDLEDALPNSVRVSADCIEFLPVRTVSRYVSIPRAMSAASMTLEASDGGGIAPEPARIAVNPDAAEHIYDAASSVLSPTATFSVPDAGGIITATFATAHAFAEDSPQERVFLVDSPVSYCVSGQELYRHSGYGYLVTQPGPADLPAAPPQRNLLVTHIDADATQFTESPGGIIRNTILELRLVLRSGEDVVDAVRTVHIRHVP